MKKINKFSILAIILTAFYVLIGKFIMSDMYIKIPNILFWVTDILYLGCMVASVTVGAIGIIKVYKEKQKIKWSLLLLTTFNACVFIVNLAITFSLKNFFFFKL